MTSALYALIMQCNTSADQAKSAKMASNQLLWKLLAAVRGAAALIHCIPGFGSHAGAWVPSGGKNTNITNSRRKSCLQIPSPLRRNSLVSQLRCTFANYIKARGPWYMRAPSAPPPSPCQAQKARTHAEKSDEKLIWPEIEMHLISCFHHESNQNWFLHYKHKRVCTDSSRSIYNYLSQELRLNSS